MSDLVVKHNALINASYNLSLVEQRLILLGVVSARASSMSITANSILEVHASQYTKQFNVEKHTAYEALKSAVAELFKREFSYTQPYKNTQEQVRSRWVSRIAYVDDQAIVKITFAPDVIPLITELETRFTQYELEQVSELSSAYAIRLYELLIAWRSTGKTPTFELAEFRKRLGVGDGEYTRADNFKRRVLDLAITQINEHTDITVSYKQHKKGRVITGFSFSFTFKKQKNSKLGAHEEIYPLPLIKPSTTKAPVTNDNAAKRDALTQFLGYQQRAKLLNEAIEQLATEKEIQQFKKYEFMK
jgi:plasmid replication initiation protein